MTTPPASGSVANSELELGSVTVEIHADHPVQSLQRPSLPGRGDCSVRPLVPPIPLAYQHVAELLAERGVEVDPSLYLALGPSLRTRIEQTLPATSKGHEQKLSHRRNIYKGKR